MSSLNPGARSVTVLMVCVWLLWGCGASGATSPSSADASSGAQRMVYAEMEAAREEVGHFDEMAPAPAVAPSAPPNAKMSAGDGAQSAVDLDVASVEPQSENDARAELEASEARRPLLIYTADLSLGVFRVQQNLDAIEKMAVDAGGYLVSRGDNRVTVRVPAKDFEKTIEVILKLGDVHRREIYARDVTSEYTDLQIRLKNALAMRQRLEELLQKAMDVKEALKVEEQLGRVAEQIEMMKGRLKMLRELTSFSTISVEFSERSAPIDSRVELPFEFLDELGLETLLNL